MYARLCGDPTWVLPALLRLCWDMGPPIWAARVAGDGPVLLNWPNTRSLPDGHSCTLVAAPACREGVSTRKAGVPGKGARGKTNLARNECGKLHMNGVSDARWLSWGARRSRLAAPGASPRPGAFRAHMFAAEHLPHRTRRGGVTALCCRHWERPLRRTAPSSHLVGRRIVSRCSSQQPCHAARRRARGVLWHGTPDRIIQRGSRTQKHPQAPSTAGGRGAVCAVGAAGIGGDCAVVGPRQDV